VPCTRRLRRGESLSCSPRSGLALMCCAGSIEVAVQGAAAFVLTEGERFTLEREGRLTIIWRRGPKNEWLADMGIAVIAFLPGPRE
jgi:hypothetical protein